jgi:hypothetical protein
MYWDVIAVKVLPDYCLYVEIKNGRAGIFLVRLHGLMSRTYRQKPCLLN